MPHVIIYTTPTCFYCKIAKEFLTKNAVSFEERDVVKNPAFIKEMEEKSHQRSVPLIEIGDELFVGFDRPAIVQALGIHE